MNSNLTQSTHDLPRVYIGTVLMEKNRWTREKDPSVSVSEWLDRFQADGFSGIELWSFHATKVSDGEVEKLRTAKLPVPIFNSYVTFEEGSEAAQDVDGEMAIRLGATAIKYNVGPDPDRRQLYMDQVRAWRERLPEEITLLCECHPGTVIEEPKAARAFFDEAGLDNHGIIAHPFFDLDRLAQWLDLFGSELMHTHLQMRDSEFALTLFRDDTKRCGEALAMLKEAGYRGSYTLEFTKGVSDPHESPEMLYANALKDLASLREMMG